MYGRNFDFGDARQLFDELSEPDEICWTSVISAFIRNDMYSEALAFFNSMQRKHRFSLDAFTFGTVLTACGNLGRARQGREVHAKVITSGVDVIVESALVDLYAKCGCVDFAYRVFKQMPDRNLITWNTMIRGFAQNGRIEGALALFDDMVKQGVKPDYITFIGVLFACSHSGLVDQGKRHFTSMVSEYGIRPGIEHYNCMVDLLGRAGLIEEAEALLENADCRDDSSLWTVLLGACATCTNPATAERIAKRTMELKPEYHLSYVYLANVYRGVGRWDDADSIRRLMEERQVKKVTGKSWS
ncbi:Pentatricopeptide repeat-containing protein At1g03540 [Linum perenne]